VALAASPLPDETATPSGIPAYVLICKRCGFVRLHALKVLLGESEAVDADGDESPHDVSVESAEYSESEWQASIAARPLEHLPPQQVVLLHRHWLWAEYARNLMQRRLAKGAGSDPGPWESEGSFAMVLWHALLYSVVEGVRNRRVRLMGRFRDDLRAVAEPLRMARDAMFQVGNDDAYYDLRLVEPLRQLPAGAVTITRVHHGFARLLLEEMHKRNAAGRAEPSEHAFH